MSNELATIGSGALATVTTKGKNYILNSPFTGLSTLLERNIDFGLIPKTTKPTLYKSGAEKVIYAYGLMPIYTIESKIEQYDGKSAFFMYVVKCELIKGFYDGDGHYQQCVYTSGFGSANTGEKRNGFNDAVNSANSTLKMAQKRAMVSAAVSLGGLSSMFTMDIEDENMQKKASELINEKPDSPVSTQQIKRLFAIAQEQGLTQAETKNKLASWGYSSTKDILVKDYDNVINKIKEIN